MVQIGCDLSQEKVFFIPSGQNFADIVEVLRNYYCSYNAAEKRWETSIAKYEDVAADLLYAGGYEEYLEISELTKQQIASYLDSIKELKYSTTRRVFNIDLMNYDALPGKAPFENFQRQDLIQALNRNRYLFNWEMGLGKSWALTALIEHLRYYDCIGKALIFSSSIGVWNVKSELLKFGKNQKDEDILVLTSASEIPADKRNLFDKDVYPYKTIIMTYDCLKAISNFYYDKEKGTPKNPKPSAKTKYKKMYIPFDDWAEGKPIGLFLDECHLLGSTDSRRSQIMSMCLDYFEYRYLFTGTLADKYQKLYMPCKILDKALIKGMDYISWLSSYNDIGTRFSKYAVNPNGWDLIKIAELNKQLVTNYGIKRDKKDCLDLPDNYMIPTIWIEMSDKQRAIYEEFSNESARMIQEEAKEANTTSSARMINMFQFFQSAVDNPEIILDSERFEKFSPKLQDLIKKFSYVKDYRKLDVLDSIIEERVDEEKEKGIIWCYHPKTISAIAKRYAKYSPFIVDNTTKIDERFEIVEQFKKSTSNILISSIPLLNTSITLTECGWQAYLEKTYNFVEYSQSLGRIYRPGQEKTTRTYTIRYARSIDSLQESNLESKGHTINCLMSKKFITQTEWAKIFNGYSVI